MCIIQKVKNLQGELEFEHFAFSNMYKLQEGLKNYVWPMYRGGNLHLQKDVYMYRMSIFTFAKVKKQNYIQI